MDRADLCKKNWHFATLTAWYLFLGRSPGGSSGGEAALIGWTSYDEFLKQIPMIFLISCWRLNILWWDKFLKNPMIFLIFYLLSFYLSSWSAAGGSVLGIGSDVGGSLRIPAHFSGLDIFYFSPSPEIKVIIQFSTITSFILNKQCPKSSICHWLFQDVLASNLPRKSDIQV